MNRRNWFLSLFAAPVAVAVVNDSEYVCSRPLRRLTCGEADAILEGWRQQNDYRQSARISSNE